MPVTIDGSSGVTTNAGGLVNPSTNVDGINYSCRAWVNFNGTGTVAIRASGNVSSITDNGTGDYTINFTTAMSDANYSSVVSGGSKGNGYTVGTSEASAPTSSSFRVLNSYAGVGVQDATYVFASVFR